MRINIAWPTTATEKSIPSRAVQTTVTLDPSPIILHRRIPPSGPPTFLQPVWLRLSLCPPFTIPVATARPQLLRDGATLPTRDMHLPVLSTVTRPLASSLLQDNRNSIFRLCSRSLTPDQPILLRQISVVTMTIVALHTAKNRMAKIPTMRTIAGNLPLQGLHQMATVILMVYMSTPQLDLAARLL